MADPTTAAKPAAVPVTPSPRPGQPPINGKPAEPAPAPETKPAPADDRLAELAKQTKRLSSERMKFAHEMAKQKEEMAKQMEEYQVWKKQQEGWRLNPEKAFEAQLGKDWYDKVTKMRLEGVPPADLIASELDERETKLRKEMDEREQKTRKEFEDYKTQEHQRIKAEYEAQAVDFVKSNATKYPYISHFEEFGSVPKYIEEHFQKTAKESPDGQGELLTAQQAADLIEKRIAEIGKRFEEAKAKQAATPSTAAPVKRNDSQQRRTLSTDLTAGSAAEAPPPKDDRERAQRAKAAWDAVKAARQS